MTIDELVGELESIEYFALKKQLQPKTYNYAQRAIKLSNDHTQDWEILTKKITDLTRVPEPNQEQRRQSANMLAEFKVFVDLIEAGEVAHWVPETTAKMPDVCVAKDQKLLPYEVKHLNPPRFEDEATANGISVGGSVNFDYHVGFTPKIQSYIDQSVEKFTNYKLLHPNSSKGTLVIVFSKSFEAMVADAVPWGVSMQDRVTQIAERLAHGRFLIEAQDIQGIAN